MEDVALAVGETPVHATYRPPTGKAVGAVLLVHGFNSDQREFGPLPDALADAGLHVLAWDQRGFGQSGGERGLTDLDAIVAEARVAVSALQERAGDVPMGAVGHSLGAAFVCGLFDRGEAPFRAVVLAHPPKRLLDEASLPAAVAYHAIGRLNEARHARGRPNGSIPNPVRTKALFQDPALRRGGAPFLTPRINLGTYRFGHEMDAASWARAVDVPVLGVTSRHDKVVRPSHIEQVLGAIAGPLTRMEHDAGHSLFLDTGGHERCKAIASWLADRLREAA